MKKLVFITALLLITANVFAQKEVSAAEIVSLVNHGKPLVYENVIINGEIDLSNSSGSTITGKYPENGKTVYVLSNFVKQPVTFKHCTFRGDITFCRKDESANSKKEYRVEFTKDVIFHDCVFEKKVDFELTNFDKGISFAGSTFKEQPRFVRMGINQKPDLQGLVLHKGCLFQFDQSKKAQNFNAVELIKAVDAFN